MRVMRAVIKRIVIVLAIIIGLLVVIVGIYLAYVSLQYSRIPDNTTLEVSAPLEMSGASSADSDLPLLKAETAYTATTYNIGFGAYDRDYSFFMDTGVMRDGTPVQGSESRAASADIVEHDIAGATNVIAAYDPDFCLFQEVDTDSTRSFHIDQAASITGTLSRYANVAASNFHSAYLFYPLTSPHGTVNSELLTLSGYQVDEAVRRSYPVDDSWPTKFFDLDRCFSVQRIPVEGGKYLVLVNSHMSAYDEGGLIRKQQMNLLNEVLSTEYAAGNYVICGGDFNHAFPGTETAFATEQEIPEWVQVFDVADLAEGLTLVMADNALQVSTCRSADMPYTKGVNYEAVLDGFIVSDNVRCNVTNIDTGYEFSDHNPVLLTFELVAG